MLASALRALRARVKDSKLEMIDEIKVEKVILCCINKLNAQFPR